MAVENLETVEFLQRFLKKEEKALSDFFNAYWERVYAFAWQILGDEGDAEDIACEGFTKVFREDRPFSGIDQARAFLYTCVRNACFDCLKIRQRKTAREKAYQALVETDVWLENAMIEGEVMQALHSAIQRLPDKYGRVLKLLYFDGLKYREVADQLGVSIDSVKTSRRVGLSKLREFMSEQQFSLLALYLATVVCGR